MQVLVLGPLVVLHDDHPVEIRRGNPRALLAQLALRAPDTVPADVLIERLWGDALPANPANALQLQVSYLRRALALASGDGASIVTDGAGYRLAIADEHLDLRRFERLVAEGRRADRTALDRLAMLDEALALWRGEPLPELAAHPDLVGEITRLVELRVAAAERRVDALIELDRAAEAIGDLGALVGEFPLHEGFHAQLMRCLYRTGRQSEALRAYQVIRDRLLDELGLDPGPELRSLEAQILGHEVDLVPSTRAAPALAAEVGLPTPLTSLIGREASVERVLALLAGRRTVTLTGPGGTGKTRIAVEVARRFGGHVHFVDLGSVPQDDDVCRAIVDHLRIPLAPGDDPTRAVVDALTPSTGLLVLDTCEHLVDEVRSLVERLIGAAPAITVLATSRRPLEVPGELAWPVAPLSLPPSGCDDPDEARSAAAVQLFSDRAAAVRGEFALDRANVRDVVEICHAVDGLPLAIELAAAHADVLSIAGIRSRLDGRFDLLEGHGAAGPARHRALRTTIDWSIDLLTPEQRDVLVQLAVFEGTFDLDAIAALTGAPDALPLLAPLVRQSLVATTGDDRYRILDAVRARCTDLAATTPAAAGAAERHAASYAARARRADRAIRGPEQVAVVRAMEQDLPNYRAALRWLDAHGPADLFAQLATSLAWMWAVHGNTAEATHWLAHALDRDELTDRTRIAALLAASMVAAPDGHLERSLDLSLEAATRAATAGLPHHEATARLNAGVANWALGALDESRADLEVALARFEEVGSARGIALTTMNLARTALDSGDGARASELLATISVDAHAATDPQLHALILHQRARVSAHHGDHRTAATLAGRALEESQAIDHHETIAAALHVLGSVHLAAGDLDAARACHTRALAVAVEKNHIGAIVEAVESLAMVTAAGGDGPRAAQMLAAAASERERRRIPVPGADAVALSALRRQLPLPLTFLPLDLIVEEALAAS